MKILRIVMLMRLISLYSCGNQESSSPEIEEGFIEVPGGRVWYRIVGADKPGVPLLTLLGGPGAPHDYLEPMEALATDRPVIFYDQLGCGNSEVRLKTLKFVFSKELRIHMFLKNLMPTIKG